MFTGKSHILNVFFTVHPVLLQIPIHGSRLKNNNEAKFRMIDRVVVVVVVNLALKAKGSLQVPLPHLLRSFLCCLIFVLLLRTLLLKHVMRRELSHPDLLCGDRPKLPYKLAPQDNNQPPTYTIFRLCCSNFMIR